MSDQFNGNIKHIKKRDQHLHSKRKIKKRSRVAATLLVELNLIMQEHLSQNDDGVWVYHYQTGGLEQEWDERYCYDVLMEEIAYRLGEFEVLCEETGNGNLHLPKMPTFSHVTKVAREHLLQPENRLYSLRTDQLHSCW